MQNATCSGSDAGQQAGIGRIRNARISAAGPTAALRRDALRTQHRTRRSELPPGAEPHRTDQTAGCFNPSLTLEPWTSCPRESSGYIISDSIIYQYSNEKPPTLFAP